MLRLIPRIEECKVCPYWYEDDDITGCVVPWYHRFDTLPPCICTATRPSMNIIPNEDKINVPLATPLNLIGDIMKCKDCEFIIDDSSPGLVSFRCREGAKDDTEMKPVNPSATACWRFKLPKKSVTDVQFNNLAPLNTQVKKKPNTQTRDDFSNQINGPQNQIEKIGETHIPKAAGVQTTPAKVSDAVEVHYKGLHRIDYMFKQQNGIGGAICTGPDGITRYFSQNECYFVKQMQDYSQC